jgi:type IX secretion system PorP/SprF family membrane protein
MRKTRIFGALLILFSCKCAFAQDPQFSQFYASPLYLNPAFAGSTKCPRVTLNYRDQWPALRGTFVTTAASYDQYVDRLQGGMGLLILNDKAGQGTINSLNVSGFYSYQLNLTRNLAAKIGFQGTYAQKRFDFTNSRTEDMIDPRSGFVYTTQDVAILNAETKSYADFSSGALLYSSNLYLGFAAHHLTQPNESFLSNQEAPLPRKFTFHGGGIITLGKDKKYSNTYLSPGFLYQQQQDFNQLNLGLYVGKGVFLGGLWYRTSVAKGKNFLGSDSFIALIGVQQGIFKFGYSYDVTVSKLASSSAGSHELSLGMQFECRPKKKKFRTIKCPAF